MDTAGGATGGVALNRSQTSLQDGESSNNNNNVNSGMSSKEKRLAQRRCIAEDPEWNLAMVDRLSDLCIKVVVAGFESE